MFGLRNKKNDSQVCTLIWRPGWTSLILEQNDFTNAESPYCPDASHQVLVHSVVWLGRRCYLNYVKIIAAMLA